MYKFLLKMSISELSGEELLNSLDSYYKGKMPAECYDGYKKFTLCKFERNEEVLKTKGLAYFKDYSTEPLSRVECFKNEYDTFHKCYYDFLYKYQDLKNYVSQIEGKSPQYDLKEIDNDLKLGQFAFNKF